MSSQEPTMLRVVAGLFMGLSQRFDRNTITIDTGAVRHNERRRIVEVRVDYRLGMRASKPGVYAPLEDRTVWGSGVGTSEGANVGERQMKNSIAGRLSTEN